MRVSCLTGPGIALIVLAPTVASGQVLSTIEFSFSNPGARSLGIGGAFVALADDATAAFANPAGLIQLVDPEVSIEGRFRHYSTPYTAGGRAAGEPTGLGIDTVPVPVRAESTADLSGLSFVSLVYPMGDWSLAFFQHQLVDFEMTEEIQGLFASGPGFSGTARSPIERGSFDFEITTRAVAVGYRLSDRLSVGLGLSNFDPSTSNFVGEEYLPDDDSPQSFFAMASFLPERLSHRYMAQFRGSDWGLAAGFLWSVGRGWKLGGVYREGPELEFGVTLTPGPAHPELPPGQRFFLGSAPWHFPDVFGLGLSYRSSDGHWAGGFEWNRVEYSTVIESLTAEFSGSGDVIDDANEIHFGGEYTFFVDTSIVALRLGAWRDPDHQVRNVGGGQFFEAESPGGEDELHLAGGFGVAFERFQIDLGIDLSQRRDAASLSMIYSF